MEELPDVLLVSVLLLLDGPSVRQSSRVCKTWRSAIASPKFREDWWTKHGPPSLLLLSAFSCVCNRHPGLQKLLIWSRREPSSPPLPLPPWMKIPLPGTFDIVASSHGLIAARYTRWLDRHTPRTEFTVGNPVTNEWVKIPRLKHQKHTGGVYTLSTDPASGEFGLLDWHNEHIYESRTSSWVQMRVPRSFDNALLDVAGRRRVGLKKPLHFNTQDLSDLGCPCFFWEHRGKNYIGQPTRERRESVGGIFWNVWHLDSDSMPEDEDDDDAAECRELGGLLVALCGKPKTVLADESLVVSCHAEGGLLCFAARFYGDVCPCGDPLVLVVYDVDERDWCHVPALKGWQQRRAVVYRPSLLRPSSSPSPCVSYDVPDDEPLKRRRNEQPDIRKQRIKSRSQR